MKIMTKDIKLAAVLVCQRGKYINRQPNTPASLNNAGKNKAKQKSKPIIQRRRYIIV